MILLDASALISLLVDEPGAAEVEELLHGGDACLTAVGYGEVVDQALRVQGRAPLDLALALDPLLKCGALRVVDVTATIGLQAGHLRAKHYDRRSRDLSMADCVLLAAAASHGAAVATADRPLVQAARAEGLHVHLLPDSRGHRPSPPSP